MSEIHANSGVKPVIILKIIPDPKAACQGEKDWRDPEWQ
jgi:hypothetical protein